MRTNRIFYIKSSPLSLPPRQKNNNIYLQTRQNIKYNVDSKGMLSRSVFVSNSPTFNSVLLILHHSHNMILLIALSSHLITHLLL